MRLCRCGEPLRMGTQGRYNKTCGAEDCVRGVGLKRPQIAEKLRGRKNPLVGDKLRGRPIPSRRVPEPGYRSMHTRVEMHLRGRPCEMCGGTERLQSALRHDAPMEFLRGGARETRSMFSIREIDYMKLCRLCHAEYDRFKPGSLGRRNQRERLTTHCPAGHEYDEANTRVNRKGHRSCRICYQTQQRLYSARKRALTEREIA